MFELRRQQDRGQARFSWLESRHSFSFGHYRDPQHQGFSDLLVINEDRVAPGQGFETHSHRNMEIFSYVLSGALQHQDSMGNGTTIRPGDVQLMSAGSGVRHSEFNGSTENPVHFLQIWLLPRQRNEAPRYQQVHFSEEEKRGRLRLIISPDAAAGSLQILQDARVFAGLLDGAEEIRWKVPDQRYAYIHVARGQLMLNGQQLQAGDGVKIRQAGELHFSQGKAAEFLVFDLRPREQPAWE